MKKKTRSKKNARKTKRIRGGVVVKRSQSAAASSSRIENRASRASIRSSMANQRGMKKGLEQIKKKVTDNYKSHGLVGRLFRGTPNNQVEKYRNSKIADMMESKEKLKQLINSNIETLKRNEEYLRTEQGKENVDEFYKIRLMNILTSETGDMNEKLRDLYIEIDGLIRSINIMYRK